jgi:hypothetical protein
MVGYECSSSADHDARFKEERRKQTLSHAHWKPNLLTSDHLGFSNPPRVSRPGAPAADLNSDEPFERERETNQGSRRRKEQIQKCFW